ncbi:hypothetical protein JB92DRAFT_2834618 [Gautieria morchelliformis]|nr:hypothetical protein JB92DRAFT_2834618 [Gautieria morchelliformis]
MASKSRRGTISLLTIAFLTGTAHADVNPTFGWGFKTFTSLSLPECGSLELFVDSIVDSTGMTTPVPPPYILFAYESGGIPTRRLIGSDPNNVFWTVDHASQSQLVLSMTDLAGNLGGPIRNLSGVGGQVYTVVPSTSGTACHANTPTISPISITTNATNAITTCEVLPLKMSGGTKPYTVTIASIDYPFVTNFTLGAASDTYNWVNRAQPNSQIIASASDAQGIYAASTNLLSTSGSTDVTCPNQTSTELDSSAQTSAAQSSTSAATATSGESSGSSSSASSSSPSTVATATSGGSSGSNSDASTNSTNAIVGGAVGGAVLLGVLVLFMRRWATARRPYTPDDGDNGSGLGNVGDPVPSQNAPFSSVPEETSPFVTSGAQATPYMDNPPYQNSTYTSNYSNEISEATLAPVMQSRTSTYSAAPYTPPGAALPYATQQTLGSNAVISPPPSSAGFNPYAAGFMAPSNSSESTGASTAMGISGAGNAARGGSVAGSAEARPSSGRFADANPSPLDDERLGPEPPQQRRETVYQHEDIEDVTELPPAYKSRIGH